VITKSESSSLAEGALPVQVRIARPTNRFDEVIAFYRDALGMPELYRFDSHDGYDGTMLGIPDQRVHLEFTRHRDGNPCPAPTRDNLLVLYITDMDQYRRLCQRMERLGHAAVEPENPYWRDISTTFEDPDGWRIVLCRELGIS
jgi:catechol 2,3-dioxygenase-like lactoylglutathione lyase family enzyme